MFYSPKWDKILRRIIDRVFKIILDRKATFAESYKFSLILRKFYFKPSIDQAIVGVRVKTDGQQLKTNSNNNKKPRAD